jgi:multidrug resistance efflux pump
MKTPILPVRMLVTGAVVVLAVIAGLILYQRYVSHPWTRDGQVSANITLVTPQVSGWVVKVAVEDGQTVKAGDLLFEIDPRSYRLAVQSATVQLASARQQVAALAAAVVVSEANVNSAGTGVETAKGKIEAAKAQVDAAKGILASATADVTSAEASVAKAQADLENAITQRDRALRLAKDGAGSVASSESKTAQAKAAQATLDSANANVISSHGARDKAVAGLAQARANLVVAENGLLTAEAQLQSAIAGLAKARADLGEPGDANVQVRAAKTDLAKAELDLSWTRVVAPADGYVTNLVVKAGDYTSVGKPMLAFVFGGSFYVQGYFRETQLKNIKKGDRAVITLMSHGDDPLEGVVETIGFAINPPNIAQTGVSGDATLVPVVQPSFDWIRLAQRVPVRIKLTKVPEGVRLVAGVTTSVAIRPE